MLNVILNLFSYDVIFFDIYKSNIEFIVFSKNILLRRLIIKC